MDRSFLKDPGFQFLKRGLAEKLLPRFRTSGRAWEMQAQLPHLANELKEGCKSVEPEFIEIGQELQAIYKDATELTQQVLHSLSMIGGEEGEGVLSQLRGVAEQSLEELEVCQENVSEKAALIKTVTEHLQSLSDILPSAEKVGLLLGVVGVNIGIEKTRSSESTELFSVVAHEIGRLSEKIKVTSQDGLDLLKKALATQRSLYGDLSEGLKKISRMGENASGIVQDAVQEIEKLMASLIETAEKAGKHSKRISKQVGNLVVAVQFHDSMSQRVEHIAKALGDVEGFLAADNASAESSDPDDKLSLALSLINLQSAQLKDIISEIGHIYEMGARSFEEIIHEFKTLSNHLSDLVADSGQDPELECQVADPFERLRSSFDDLNNVLYQGRALMEPVRNAAYRASETVEQVSGLVQNIYAIGFETHLMALNAILKAAHLGQEGSALEVLAHEVKHSSDRSTSIMERAEELLNLVTEAADKLRDQAGNKGPEVSLEDAIEGFTQAYNRFMEASTTTRAKADEIKEAISKTKIGLEFLPLLAEKLMESLRQLEIMALDLSSLMHREHSLQQQRADHILDRYTMEKEREVHEAYLAESSFRQDRRDMPEDLSGAGKGEGGSKDVQRHTIEPLMHGPGGTQDEASGESEEFGDGTVLFDPPGLEGKREGAEEACETEGTGGSEEDLGDNVELF